MCVGERQLSCVHGQQEVGMAESAPEETDQTSCSPALNSSTSLWKRATGKNRKPPYLKSYKEKMLVHTEDLCDLG